MYQRFVNGLVKWGVISEYIASGETAVDALYECLKKKSPLALMPDVSTLYSKPTPPAEENAFQLGTSPFERVIAVIPANALS